MDPLSVAIDLATCLFANITKNGVCLNKTNIAYKGAEKSALFTLLNEKYKIRNEISFLFYLFNLISLFFKLFETFLISF